MALAVPDAGQSVLRLERRRAAAPRQVRQAGDQGDAGQAARPDVRQVLGAHAASVLGVSVHDLGFPGEQADAGRLLGQAGRRPVARPAATPYCC